MNSTRKKRRLNPTVNSENEEEVIYPVNLFPKIDHDFLNRTSFIPLSKFTVTFVKKILRDTQSLWMPTAWILICV